MPIFHVPYDPSPSKPTSRPSSPDEPRRGDYTENDFGRPLLEGVYRDIPAAAADYRPIMLNRVELIERIKRGNSPSWQQSHEEKSNVQRKWKVPGMSDVPNHSTHHTTTNSERRPNSGDRPKTPHSNLERRASGASTPDPLREHATAGMAIERPRSALHSGDFREKKDKTAFQNGVSDGGAPLATSPVAPWHHSFPASLRSINLSEPLDTGAFYEGYDSLRSIRSRAVSQSSPFVFMPPTSPLVQQSNNTDLDFSSRPSSRQASRSPERSNRRHTFSPHSFQIPRSTQGTQLRREGTHPYQAHQPRRSLTSMSPFLPLSTPQTPLMQPRRPSISFEASPLHHAPMVGSYEESILRGRMSTTPSRPLNFVARIGVLGKGQCKASLRCPPHVTVPFPAVFYSYSGGNSQIADNSPSPYVGLIDLENSLPSPDDSGESKRKRRHTILTPSNDESAAANDSSTASQNNIRRREKNKRRSTSPKAPPGGSYRIPQVGQLQIVIKNPNATAVKLFLVPYDLSDMEPGQKTFVRQRSYSAGPIIDMPLSSRTNLGTDRPEAALGSNPDDPNDRPILRYLIHLHICCTGKGRYYLYKSIRVVFANRVPDGKEKLRNETQVPDPPYSAYKPTTTPSTTSSTTTARDSGHMRSEAGSVAVCAGTVETRAYWRRSCPSQQALDRLEGYADRARAPQPPPPAIQFAGGGDDADGFAMPPSASSLDPIPFSLSQAHGAGSSRVGAKDAMDVDATDPFAPRTSIASPNQDDTETYEKLKRGDVGYGGGGRNAGEGPGLLARKLRGLDVQPPHD